MSIGTVTSGRRCLLTLSSLFLSDSDLAGSTLRRRPLTCKAPLAKTPRAAQSHDGRRGRRRLIEGDNVRREAGLAATLPRVRVVIGRVPRHLRYGATRAPKRAAAVVASPAVPLRDAILLTDVATRPDDEANQEDKVGQTESFAHVVGDDVGSRGMAVYVRGSSRVQDGGIRLAQHDIRDSNDHHDAKRLRGLSSGPLAGQPGELETSHDLSK